MNLKILPITALATLLGLFHLHADEAVWKLDAKANVETSEGATF